MHATHHAHAIHHLTRVHNTVPSPPCFGWPTRPSGYLAVDRPPERDKGRARLRRCERSLLVLRNRARCVQPAHVAQRPRVVQVGGPEAEDELCVVDHRSALVVAALDGNEHRMLVAVQHIGVQLAPAHPHASIGQPLMQVKGGPHMHRRGVELGKAAGGGLCVLVGVEVDEVAGGKLQLLDRSIEALQAILSVRRKVDPCSS